MKKLLLLTAALSLLSAPAAMAQHRHHDGNGRHAHAGRHAQAARHAHANRHRQQVQRRARANHRHVRRDRAYHHRANNHRAYDRRHAYSHRNHWRNGRVSHRYGHNRHWRHVARVGRWHRGVRLPYGYWRGRPWVNWRSHYLWAPPYGYQWVYVDGNYLLIAIGTGLIADIVAGY